MTVTMKASDKDYCLEVFGTTVVISVCLFKHMNLFVYV
jgi:hypothetical protein